MVKIIRKDALRGTPRHVRSHAYETFRFLLADDDIDVTVTDITLAPDIEENYGSEVHTEIAYCIEGHAELTDLGSNETHLITPGTIWIARPRERFRFRASITTRLICVFSPPYAGGETGFATNITA